VKNITSCDSRQETGRSPAIRGGHLALADRAADLCHATHAIGTAPSRVAPDVLRMAAGVRDLKVWQEAVALGGEVLRLVRQSARREIKSATDAIILTALAVASHIAEGYGRFTVPEQRHCYRAAKRDLLRLETQLAILRHAELLSVSAHGDLLKRVHNVARLLAGYIVYLERQRATEDEDATSSKPLTAAASS
jgi:four helix bundle protein